MLICGARREGAERDGREGKRQGTTERRTARYQEIREKIVGTRKNAMPEDTTASWTLNEADGLTPGIRYATRNAFMIHRNLSNASCIVRNFDKISWTNI